jgi:DNA-binding beta-propeller fold protein YncE
MTRPVHEATMILLMLALAAAPVPTAIPLPGGPPVSMDYLAYEVAGDRIWVPAGNTGRVDVVDAKTAKVTAVEGFPTSAVTGRDGRERLMGPSSVTIGNGFAYVGNRANSQVCAIDIGSLARKGCVTLPSSPDGIAWVSTTREVWVTTPQDGSITILDVKDPAAPKVAGRIAVAHPEGYAVDGERGLFYTNEEEGDRTLVIDVRRREVVRRWSPSCGPDGPRGLALDHGRRQLLVACTTSVKVLDAGKDGSILGQVEVGSGVDNIDYLESQHRVYAAAGRAGTLTVAEVSEGGTPTLLWSAPAADGGRVVVVDSRGAAFVADSKGGRLLVFK